MKSGVRCLFITHKDHLQFGFDPFLPAVIFEKCTCGLWYAAPLFWTHRPKDTKPLLSVHSCNHVRGCQLVFDCAGGQSNPQDPTSPANVYADPDRMCTPGMEAALEAQAEPSCGDLEQHMAQLSMSGTSPGDTF